MNAIERIKALSGKPTDLYKALYLNAKNEGWNAAIDKVLAILEEEKPVDPCAFADFIMDQIGYLECNSKEMADWINGNITTEQLLEIYKQTLK
jgi:hypothetical protein